jgi:hypothetical protein
MDKIILIVRPSRIVNGFRMPEIICNSVNCYSEIHCIKKEEIDTLRHREIKVVGSFLHQELEIKVPRENLLCR